MMIDSRKELERQTKVVCLQAGVKVLTKRQLESFIAKLDRYTELMCSDAVVLHRL